MPPASCCFWRWSGSKASAGAPRPRGDARAWSGGEILRRQNFERLTDSPHLHNVAKPPTRAAFALRVLCIHMERPWFGPKRYGWGWRPVSWQGWLLVALFVAFVAWNAMRIDAASHSVSDMLRPFIIETVLMALVLGIICQMTSRGSH